MGTETFFSQNNTLEWIDFKFFFISSIMSDLNKFINAADRLIELITDFNDYDSNSHTEDILEIHSEEVTELCVNVSY